MCDQWFWSEDKDGNDLPFDAVFGLWIWTGEVYSFVDQYEFGVHGLKLDLQLNVQYKCKAILPPGYADDWTRPPDKVFLACKKDITLVYGLIVEEVPDLVFVNVAVSRRYGERLYLSGSICNIVKSDEICVYFSRPGDTGIRNLKSDTSGQLRFTGTSGSYDLGANNRYIEFERAGYHWLQIWDVSGGCETPLVKRAEWLMNVVLPRYQYQLIFDRDNPDLGDNLWRLEAEYATFESARGWRITHEDPDCFPLIAGSGGGVDETPQSGWLSLGVEFGESACAPIPYYLCPLPTPQTQYWRGECSCSEFKNTLQPLGIPCWHLIAAKAWYSGETPWSDYIKCP